MNYIFDHENRISHLFELINICELALIITRDKVKSLVILRLDQKIENIVSLIKELESNIENDLEKLIIDLNNKKYILSHNLSANLPDLSKLEYKAQPDREIKQIYFVKECETRCVGRLCDAEVTRCWNEPKDRMVPDKQFHEARDKYVNSIKSEAGKIKNKILEFAEMNAVLNVFEKYRSRISPKPKEKVLFEEKPLVFIDIKKSSSKTNKTILNETELAEFFNDNENFDFEDPNFTQENQSFNGI
jgi:hypothetical protein